MGCLNLYATLADLKTMMGISGTTNDGMLEEYLEDASRYIDEMTGRYFYTRTATLYCDTNRGSGYLFLPEDCISVTTFTTDTEYDGTYDGETWTENTDFWLEPANTYPKTRLIITEFGNYSFAENEDRQVKIIGTWGYGDGTSNPWATTAITVTVADATTTTLTLSAEGTLKVGHTIKCGTEQMYVSAVTDDESDEATVIRGVNGTTAAAQAGATASIALYPRLIRRACMNFAKRDYLNRAEEGFESERLGDYYYKRFSEDNQRERDLRLVGVFRRMDGM